MGCITPARPQNSTWLPGGATREIQSAGWKLTRHALRDPLSVRERHGSRAGADPYLDKQTRARERAAARAARRSRIDRTGPARIDCQAADRTNRLAGTAARRRRGGIWNPAQDAQLKEAEDLPEQPDGRGRHDDGRDPANAKSAAPSTRCRREPSRGGATSPGSAASMHSLAAGEPANIRFEWRQGALTVVGSSASVRRRERRKRAPCSTRGS